MGVIEDYTVSKWEITGANQWDFGEHTGNQYIIAVLV
jgi:hypothetical protein